MGGGGELIDKQESRVFCKHCINIFPIKLEII